MNDKIRQLFVNNYALYNPNAVSEFFKEETNNVKPEIIGSRYMSKRVYGFIRNRLHYKIEREYIFDNTRVSLQMFCINKSFCFTKLYNVLNFYIFVLNKLKHKPVLKIVLYLTNLKKLFPSNLEQVLNEDNINSGVTMLNEGERMIVIYRKEELFKVLLHELIHAYEIDFHFYNIAYDKYFMDKYSIKVSQPYKNKNNPLALYESYTDTLACYGHIITNVLFKSTEEEITSLDTEIDTLLEKESKHYMLQAAKIFKFSYLREDTHSFSYYLVKACIYRNFASFKKFIDNNGIVLNTIEKQTSFLEFIKQNIDNPEFWKELKRIRTRKIVLSGLKMTKIKW
jgi:hypothetical protein